MAVGSIPDSSNCAEKFLTERAPQRRARTDRGVSADYPHQITKEAVSGGGLFGLQAERPGVSGDGAAA